MKKIKFLIIINLLVLAVLAFSLLKIRTLKSDETPWSASSVSKEPVFTAKSTGILNKP